MAYYQIINGVRYDRDLLDAADQFTQGRGEYRISLDEMTAIFPKAGDGGQMTSIEINTLRYIAEHYPLTDKAQKWFAEQFPPVTTVTETIIDQVLRQEYGLAGIQCLIDENTVEPYGINGFETALRGAIEGFLHASQGQLSFVACVSRRDLMYPVLIDPTTLLKTYLEQGTLYLIPAGATADTPLPYDLPDGLATDQFWVFVLQTPDFEPVEFFAFVHREQAFYYSKGQFSKKADLQQIIRTAIRQYAQFDQMEWHIDTEEVARQMAVMPRQNFGNALFAALHTGIFNQESSFSFGDFIRQEIWPDPETGIATAMRAYANSGTLYLIPMDSQDQTDFPVPDQTTLYFDSQWIFGLAMPKKTNVRLLLTAPRENNDGNTAWSEGFIHAPVSIQHIVEEEFNLDGLQFAVHEAVYEQQRMQWGPEWRHLPGLFRQVINTVLYDYLSVDGIFNITAKSRNEDIDPAAFDDPAEYQEAVRWAIRDLLKTGEALTLMPGDDPEWMAPNGELIQNNWIFRLVLPALADHWFWVIIPRWPEDEQRPYNYIS